jgi:hypothetical protein
MLGRNRPWDIFFILKDRRTSMTEIPEHDRQRVLEVIAPLVAMFPNFKPEQPEITFEIYVRILVDMDPLMLEAAIFSLLSQPLEFMPTAGKIRHTAASLVDRASGVMDAFEAWGLVQSCLDAGAGHPIIGQSFNGSGDKQVDKAVRYLGGWRSLSMSDNHTADRARFIQCWDRMSERDREERTMLPQIRQAIAALTDDLVADRARLEKK